MQGGCDTILLIRLGAYVEFEFPSLLEFHRASGKDVTRLSDGDGPLDFWLMNAHPSRPSPVSLRERLCKDDAGFIAHYDQASYVNRLVRAADLRHLVMDAFSLRYSIRPAGKEIESGVWLDDNARLHPHARVSGPAYIGRGTRIQAAALIARFSSVERSCNIGCGTVIADASILSQTYLGAWLDVAHAVVYGSKIAHLRHNVVVDIQDDRLIRRASAVQPFRRFFPGIWES